MSTETSRNINWLTRNWPDGCIFTQRYLSELGFYHDLVQQYKKGQWIEPVGRGAFKKKDDQVTWQSGIAAIQNQLHLFIHPGGRTALELSGYGHYIRFHHRLFLFGIPAQKLPKWFSTAEWNISFTYHQTQLFTDMNLGLTERNFNGLKLKISSPERAALEMLYLVPKYQGFDEADKISNGLMTLRPKLVQSLLETCRSIKAKRLFLYFADRNSHPWFYDIDLKTINLGAGKRVIIKNGKYNSTYQISVPEIAEL